MNKLVFSLLILSTAVFSQPNQTSFIPLSVDYSFFKGSENQIYIEVYLSFFEKHLQYAQMDTIFQAEYLASLEINRDDSTIFREFDRRLSEVDSLDYISGQRKFINIFNHSLDYGNYTAKVTVKDLKSPKLGEYFFEFETPMFLHGELALSNIQLCSKIIPDTTKSDFQKNSYLTIPNPENTFSIAQPVLYYYAELYNLEISEKTAGQYTIHCKIMDLENNLVKDYPAKTVEKPGVSAVLVGGHNIVTLPSDTYFFTVEIQDQQSMKTVSSSKRFNFIKPSKQIIVSSDSAGTAVAANINISEYLQHSEQDLDREFDQLTYITSQEQKSIFQNLDIESKRLFLAKFWQKFDQTPETEINEFKNQYFKLIEYANLNYGSMNKDGWKTDRGRILLTYGIPNEIDRNYMAIDMKPHEIWHYHELEGGSLFVFADLTGFGDFDLLHSTFSRELYQPDWERLVRKTQGGVNFESGPN